MDASSAVQVGVTFTWLGMVLGISFLEAPIKFRAPGVTAQLGVGIGRLVFRALNRVEAALAVVLLVCVAVQRSAPLSSVVLVTALCSILLLGAAVLRPAMDRRVRAGSVADGIPRHGLHLGYILLECLKVAVLAALGVTLLLR